MMDPVTPPAGPPPTAPALPPPPLRPARSSQLALGVFLGLVLGFLLFRGTGNGTWHEVRATVPVSPGRLDLNRATPAELAQISGIGPTLAHEIAAHRDRSGPFRSVEELRGVKGVGPATFEKVRAFLRVEPADQEGAALADPLVLERKREAPPAGSPAGLASSPTPGGGRKLQPGDPPLNVNTATVEELQRLPGVGPVIARNIVAAREAGEFRSLADLRRVKGIGPKTLEKLRPFAAFE